MVTAFSLFKHSRRLVHFCEQHVALQKTFRERLLQHLQISVNPMFLLCAFICLANRQIAQNIFHKQWEILPCAF